jgi:hypothetical protein
MVGDPSANWTEAFEWQNVLPPSRPSADQLLYFLSYLEALPRDRPVLVLGSTPEYRDLLGVLGFSLVFVVDKSISFHRHVSKARHWTNLETLVVQDWRDFLPSCPTKFVAILSDLTSGNIPYADRFDFYRSIGRALAPGGLFFDKLLTHRAPLRAIAPLYNKYTMLPVTSATSNEFNCAVLFTSEILRDGVLNTNDAYAALSGVGHRGFWSTYITHNHRITPNNCIWFYGVSYGRAADIYGSALDVIEEKDEPSYSPYHGFGMWVVAKGA